MEVNTLNLTASFNRNIVLVLDSFFLIGLGLYLLSIDNKDNPIIIFSVAFIVIGIVHAIRKIKTFHLDKNILTIKRPLIPFTLLDEQYLISEIKEVKFHKLKIGSGELLTIRSNRKNGDFGIALKKSQIDEFEIALNKLGVKTIRNRI